MDLIECEKSEQDSSAHKFEASELVEIFLAPCTSAPNTAGSAISHNLSAQNIQYEQSISEDKYTIKNSINKNTPTDKADNIALNNHEDNLISQESLTVTDISVLHNTSDSISNFTEKIAENASKKLCEAVIKVSRPLCADYKSDSESDSSTVLASTTTDTSSESDDTSDDSDDSGNNGKENKLEEKKLKTELCLFDLPPIEELKITVSAQSCVEIGTVTSIVDTLVVVESYKDTAALDIDTVLFLDYGKRTLGKIFDILGPISEPVYTVRFNSQEQLKNLNIEKRSKVYYAPKTQYTNFVFMSEVLKNRGSDASWRDNAEAPPEFQDFSDDEQERLYQNKQVRGSAREDAYAKEQTKSKKRPYNNMKRNSGVFQTSGFRNPNFYQQRIPNIPRNSSGNMFAPSFSWRPPAASCISNPIRGVFLHPQANSLAAIPPSVCFPSRFSGPSFPVYGAPPLLNENQNFQQHFHQQGTHGFCQNIWPWERPMFIPQLRLPPPPPPPASQ